jgi:hypothetical protein
MKPETLQFIVNDKETDCALWGLKRKEAKPNAMIFGKRRYVSFLSLI